MTEFAALTNPDRPPLYLWTGSVPPTATEAAATVVVEATSPVRKTADGWRAIGSCVVRVVGSGGVTGPAHHREDQQSATRLAESLVRRMKDARGF